MRTVEAMQAVDPSRLRLVWSGGPIADFDLAGWMKTPAFAPLRDPAEFA
ncbi:MAG TPA: hypothetical protein VGG29_03735 [Caulobacteraceae bacterium]|jgi:hypothetical protein